MIIPKELKLNKIASVISVIHWLISFVSDRRVFTYNLFDFSNMTSIAKAILAWGAKFAFLILLFMFWQFIAYFFIEWKNGNVIVKKYLYYTGLYFLIMILLFINLMPGLWRMDEFGILKSAANILPDFWQGYLTSVFYIFAMMLVPDPSGIVLVQIGVISLIVGYIIYKCSGMIRRKGLVYLMYLPFLLFPVIDSNFYPIRMSLYAFLELLFAFELFCIKQEHREIKTKNILLLALLAGILVCWRTEAIYYMILAPVTFIVLFYKETTRRAKLQFTIATLTIAGVLTAVQLAGNKLTAGNEYELTSIILPITPLINEAAENGDEEILETIDKVLDINILIKGYQEGETGISMYWGEEDLKRAYTSEDFSNLKSAYYQLVLKYPGVFIKERVETFIGSTGVLNDTGTMFWDDTKDYYVDFREAYDYKEPVIREKLINLLEFTDNIKVHNVIYSVVPPTLLLLGACLVLLIRRKWGYFFILANVCAKIPLIFLTAPSRLFMYYYSIYLVGAVLIGMILVFGLDMRLKNRR